MLGSLILDIIAWYTGGIRDHKCTWSPRPKPPMAINCYEGNYRRLEDGSTVETLSYQMWSIKIPFVFKWMADHSDYDFDPKECWHVPILYWKGRHFDRMNAEWVAGEYKIWWVPESYFTSEVKT